MHTILIGGPEAEALTAPTDFAATDSNAGKAKDANEDFKKSRLFMGIFYAIKFREKCNVRGRTTFIYTYCPIISQFRHTFWRGI